MGTMIEFIFEMARNPILFAINAPSKNIDTSTYIGVLGKYIILRPSTKISNKHT